MRRAWANTGCLMLASMGLLTGCGRSTAPQTADAAATKSESKPTAPVEPAPFRAPKGVAVKRIDVTAPTTDRAIRTTSNEDREPAQPTSVLKRPSPKTANANTSPQPLPLRTARKVVRNEGSFETVEARVRTVIDSAFAMADRGAIYSARSDLMSAIHALCAAKDAANQDRVCSQALVEALNAMDEAADFVVTDDVRINLRNVIAGHQTQVLKDANLEKMSTITAMQRYYDFAQSQLIIAGDGSPVASEALSGLGKVARRLPADDAALRRNSLVTALVFQQSAVAVWNQNYHAANECGWLYCHLGRPQQAKQFLVEVAQETNWPTAWSNLARVHEDLQEFDLAESARFEMREAQKVLASKGAVKTKTLEFKVVSPEQLMAVGSDVEPPAMAARPRTAPR
jgi:hypothetical protein